MTGKAYSIGAIGALFAFIAIGIASLGMGGRTELDTFLRRTRGDRLDAKLTDAQAGYTLETRAKGRIGHASITDVDGRLVFLNFWGTFCPPCIEELPSLLGMARAHEKDGVVVVAVSYDESWEVIDKFFEEFTSAALPSNFIVMRDPERSGDRDFKSSFGTKKIPESYLLRDGVTVARYINARDWLDPDFVGVLKVLQDR